MSNKVRVAARQVNVTPVILGAVTEALYKPRKRQALSAARRWSFCFVGFWGSSSWNVADKKEFNRGVRKGFAEFAEHSVRTTVQVHATIMFSKTSADSAHCYNEELRS